MAVIVASFGYYLAHSNDSSAATKKPTELTSSRYQGYQLGLVFKPTATVSMTGISYFTTGTHDARSAALYDATGHQLATATLASSPVTGWNVATLSQPVTLTSGQSYVTTLATSAWPVTDPSALKPWPAGTLSRIQVQSAVTGRGTAFPTHRIRMRGVPVLPSFTAVGPAPTTTPTPVSTVSPTPVKTDPPISGGGGAPKGSFPNASNTGVPAGTSLSSYTSPCTITRAGTVIDGKEINCSDGTLLVKASNVVIKNSKINGTLSSDSDTSGASIQVTDSEIDAGKATFAAVSSHNVTLLRVNVHGGKDSVQCNDNCTVKDSWLHGQYIAPDSALHLNGFISNGGRDMTLTHNTIACDAKITRNDGGCTADISIFGDFEPTIRFTMDSNYLVASESLSYCAYGGYDQGKPYANQVANISFTNNVFQRGANGKCGLYGAITSFNPDKPGMVWKGNSWEDGKALASAM